MNAWECWDVGYRKDGYSAAWDSQSTRQLEAVGPHLVLFVVLQERQTSLPLVFFPFNIQPFGTAEKKVPFRTVSLQTRDKANAKPRCFSGADIFRSERED